MLKEELKIYYAKEKRKKEAAAKTKSEAATTVIFVEPAIPVMKKTLMAQLLIMIQKSLLKILEPMSFRVIEIFILGLFLISCNTTTVVEAPETSYNILLPFKLGGDSFTNIMNGYEYGKTNHNKNWSYSYFGSDLDLIFRYSYKYNTFVGSPFIYTFDYFFNDTFTLICEVANPNSLDNNYFIDSLEVFPDKHNLIHYKFKNASHNGFFTVKITMRNPKFETEKREWIKKT